MAHYVLVHGAFHGGWCWELVKPKLEAFGHRVSAPDLPSCGRDRTPVAEVTLEQWAKFVARECTVGGGKAVLVGHSRGGIVISQAAQYAPDSVASLIYLSAFLVEDGLSLNDVRSATDAGQPPPFEPTPDGKALTVAPDAARALFYNLTPEPLATRAIERLRPEAVAPLSTPVNLTPERYGSIPRAYIECTRDAAILLDLQRRMQQAMPCHPVLRIDSDHSPFYSAPEKLADHLIALA